ncbi:MAG: SDR family oxidoreductase [Myxococcaceae bacterium]|nr:SDR family oxidoreductase [Myxococcaceae bacterium]
MILLTGGSGHVGQNLLRELLAQGAQVRALVRPGTSRAPFEGLKVELAEGDLTDGPSLRKAMQDVTHVYHCAARVQTVRGRERELYATNVLGTRALLRAARDAKVKRVVVTSSLGAVGHPGDRPATEDDGFNPFEHHLPYEASKAWVEHECLKAVVEGLDVVIGVSTAVLGPYDFGPSRMGRVIKDFANRKLGAYIPGGFEFVGAQDLARGHILAMEKGQTGQRYILSSEFLTVDALMDLLEKIAAVPKPKLRLPPAVMMGVAHVSTAVLNTVAPERPQRFTPDAVRLLSMQRRASCDKAKSELGYRPTPIEGAVQAAYDWFVAHGDVAKPSAART